MGEGNDGLEAHLEVVVVGGLEVRLGEVRAAHRVGQVLPQVVGVLLTRVDLGGKSWAVSSQ